MRFRLGRWDNKWHSCQWSIGENTIVIMRDGFWFRLERWKQQGYWITWSVQKRFGERFGYELPVWWIGKEKKFRIACFDLETPGWYYTEKKYEKLRLVK
jgi:hypothetical protein